MYIAVGGTVSISLTDGIDQGLTSGPFTIPAATWTRVYFNGTTDAHVSRTLTITNAAVPAATIEIDGVQLETGLISTPYIETNGGTASRSAARVQLPTNSLFSSTTGWIAFRFRAEWANAVEPGGGADVDIIWSWANDSNNRLELFYSEANNRWETRRVAGGAAGTSAFQALAVSVGDLMTVVMAWTNAGTKVSTNGAVFATGANTNIPVMTATTCDLGRRDPNAGTVTWAYGETLWVATGSGILTDADAGVINGFGSTDPTLSGMLGGLPEAAHVSAIWPANNTIVLQPMAGISGGYTPSPPAGGRPVVALPLASAVRAGIIFGRQKDGWITR